MKTGSTTVTSKMEGGKAKEFLSTQMETSTVESGKLAKKEGKGTYIVKQSGAKLVGNWADGKLMKGNWILRDGSHFEGSFDHNMPKGKGIWSFKNGNKVAGQYVQTVVPSEDDENPPITLVWNTHK
mmetsp:Transcript_2017/g.3223  ORF Transcript_2017/g.3223 Transcript_2017/m.3223 type:complete len:126 (+) Transcript_2017:243-620(+)